MNKNPYVENDTDPRFYVKKRDEFNWEDLEEEGLGIKNEAQSSFSRKQNPMNETLSQDQERQSNYS